MYELSMAGGSNVRIEFDTVPVVPPWVHLEVLTEVPAKSSQKLNTAAGLLAVDTAPFP